uniref:Microcin C transport system permease protein n=2 Tax=unclassified Candidatus Kentrum TaxID=2643149 RepID=A0A451AYI6_9GAMM|nr:MAG: microcin C transport system permease protein [Candidatus Kentron sp. LPFa]VFK35775.1 MAG: microcin C transport system permease protein [Candidatus Kentron sp. LPFa]VFK67117.1 MAG: microcin C transport system permease protein [Candidatus Kentron sp. UNK]VFK71090.1 MAG: microcin C transport system permease protein [Candidatus Kentron sp. UNK]
MTAYIIRRLLLIVPTLLGIMVINFAVIQLAPGGPVEQAIAELTGQGADIIGRVSHANTGEIQAAMDSQNRYRGAQGLDPDFIQELEARFGFDKPLHERFLQMMGDYLVFDFGESFFRDRPVTELVLDKMPVSISLGVWTTLLVYLISLPLGIAKAVRDGTPFDGWTSFVLVIGAAIPGFLFAVFLLVLFAGGSYLDWFPLGRLTSDNWAEMGLAARILDYFWHITLPVLAMVIGGFATLTMLTKNSFLDQLGQQYVLTARAKGLTERRVLYGHVFRNAMLIVIAGFPGAFVNILFTGSVLIEVIFSLDGLGLLGFEAAFQRDYPVIFGTLYFFALLGLVMNLFGDLMYAVVDPRIDFEGRG